MGKALNIIPYFDVFPSFLKTKSHVYLHLRFGSDECWKLSESHWCSCSLCQKCSQTIWITSLLPAKESKSQSLPRRLMRFLVNATDKTFKYRLRMKKKKLHYFLLCSKDGVLKDFAAVFPSLSTWIHGDCYTLGSPGLQPRAQYKLAAVCFCWSAKFITFGNNVYAATNRIHISQFSEYSLLMHLFMCKE